MAEAIYDTIGEGYARLRQPGSYEPAGPAVLAVEPSELMIRQRPQSAAPCVRDWPKLPAGAAAFDAAMAILTIHHWSDWRLGSMRWMSAIACWFGNFLAERIKL